MVGRRARRERGAPACVGVVARLAKSAAAQRQEPQCAPERGNSTSIPPARSRVRWRPVEWPRLRAAAPSWRTLTSASQPPKFLPVCGAHGRGVAAPLRVRVLDSGRVAHSARRRPCACQRARRGWGRTRRNSHGSARAVTKRERRRLPRTPPRLAQRHVRRRAARSLSRRAARRGRLAANTPFSPRGAGSWHVQMRSARGRTSSSIAEGRDRRCSYLAAAAQQASPRKLQRGRTVTRYAPVT